MFQVADWAQRKQEIADAFRLAAPLPPQADDSIYESVLAQTGAVTRQDMMILISSLQDLIMAARREEKPTGPLESFLEWLRHKQTHDI